MDNPSRKRKAESDHGAVPSKKKAKVRVLTLLFFFGLYHARPLNREPGASVPTSLLACPAAHRHPALLNKNPRRAKSNGSRTRKTWPRLLGSSPVMSASGPPVPDTRKPRAYPIYGISSSRCVFDDYDSPSRLRFSPVIDCCQYASKLYGVSLADEAGQSGQSDEEADIEAEIKKELDDIGKPAGEALFTNIRLDTDCRKLISHFFRHKIITLTDCSSRIRKDAASY
jgi:hypothetical protein